MAVGRAAGKRSQGARRAAASPRHKVRCLAHIVIHTTPGPPCWQARNVTDSLVQPFDPWDQHVAVVRKEPPPTAAPKQEEMVAEP